MNRRLRLRQGQTPDGGAAQALAFFDHGIAFMNIFQLPNALFFLGLLTQFGIRHYFIEQTKSVPMKVRQVDGLEKLLLAMMLPASLLLPPLYLFTPLLSFADYELSWGIRWSGVVIMVASLWLFWRSHLDLGQYWSMSLELRQHHQLVTHGVYRRIRHPMYASFWLWGLAQGMILANWLAGWAMILAFAAMYFIRTPREERLMGHEFGDEYREYARRTGRLIPRFQRTSEPPDSARTPIRNTKQP